MKALVVLPLSLVVGVLAGLLRTARHPDQAAIAIEGHELVVRPLGAMGFWALRREVRLPAADVTVEVADRAACPSGVRSPGAYLPGVLQAGTYRRGGEQSVWFVARATQVVLVRAPGHHPSAVVVQVADPGATVARLTTERAAV